MAGNKQVPLTWGLGGPKIGTATIDENGLLMGEIEAEHYARLGFDKGTSLSVSSVPLEDLPSVTVSEEVRASIREDYLVFRADVLAGYKPVDEDTSDLMNHLDRLLDI